MGTELPPEKNTPPAKRSPRPQLNKDGEIVFSKEVQELIETLRSEHDQINARIDGNSGRIDQISASLREIALRPPPEIGKGIPAMIAISISIALASFAATLSTIGLLLSHVLGGH